MNEYGADRKWPFAEGGGPTLLLATAVWLGMVSVWRRLPGRLTALLAALATLIWCLILYFFRDPNRFAPLMPGLVVSAGDGEVVAIEREWEGQYMNQETVRISLFLSIFDVHVQRAPADGTVRLVEHQPGKFLQAFRPEASTDNEYIAMVLETPFGPILVKQIAGIMARRCVNYASPGQRLQAGQRFGLIRFGSRVDLFLPATVRLLAHPGLRALGGITPLARFDPD